MLNVTYLFSWMMSLPYYISADCHTSPDSLSHWPSFEDDPPNQDNFKDWLDDLYSFCITLLNNWPLPPAAVPTAVYTCPFTPYILPLVSSSLNTPLLLPYSTLNFSLSYTSVFASFPKPDPQPVLPSISQSIKAIAREAQI